MTDTSWIQGLQMILPAERISTADDDLLQHSYDAWPMAARWRQQGKAEHMPDVIVRPLDTEEVSLVLSWASLHKVAVTPWGAGSSVTGAPLAWHGGISL